MPGLLFSLIVGLGWAPALHAEDKTYLFYGQRSHAQLVIKTDVHPSSLHQKFAFADVPPEIWMGQNFRLHRERVAHVFEFEHQANVWGLVLGNGSVLLWDLPEKDDFQILLVTREVAAVLFGSANTLSANHDERRERIEEALFETAETLLPVRASSRVIGEDFEYVTPLTEPLSYDEMRACERGLTLGEKP